MEAITHMLPDRGQGLQVGVTGGRPLLPVYAVIRLAHAASNLSQWGHSLRQLHNLAPLRGWQPGG